ncbi:MAG: tRNA (adenosine(37)-N6)-threonylcarbamoyltransferase complex ATPase subunit type 1 TsaE [Phycisphaeraceae bacterium]
MNQAAALTLTSPTLERTATIAAAVAQQTRPGDLIGLIGELGAGKTQFVRSLAAGLGLDPEQVSSPTFVLVQEYEADLPHMPVLVHIDAYRLHSDDELASLGWPELREGAVVAIEWADRVRGAMGEDWLEIVLKHAGDGRHITLRPHGDWADRIELLRTALLGAAS